MALPTATATTTTCCWCCCCCSCYRWNYCRCMFCFVLLCGIRLENIASSYTFINSLVYCYNNNKNNMTIASSQQFRCTFRFGWVFHSTPTAFFAPSFPPLTCPCTSTGAYFIFYAFVAVVARCYYCAEPRFFKLPTCHATVCPAKESNKKCRRFPLLRSLSLPLFAVFAQSWIYESEMAMQDMQYLLFNNNCACQQS